MLFNGCSIVKIEPPVWTCIRYCRARGLSHWNRSLTVLAQFRRQARSLAITTQKNHEVAFSVTTSEYCINELDEDNNFVQKVGIDHKIRNGIIIDRTTFSNDAAIFGTTGNLRGAAGSVYIKNSNDIAVT